MPDPTLLNLTRLTEASFPDSTDEEDKTGVNGTMRYLQDLGLNLESGEILVPLEIVQAPALAEMSKEGFVEGWKSIGCVLSRF
jgi:DCN1-like protein 1/2